MKLLIVRHAESQGNATNNYSVKTHDSLSERGLQQASALADALKVYEFDRICVSPLQRALQTIAPYLESTGRRGEIWPEISEACWQERKDEPSATWKTRPASLPEDLAPHFTFRDGRAIKADDPESFEEGLCRVHQAVGLIREVAADPDRSLLMVTHGHFIRELLNVILETRRIVRFGQDNCGMTLLTFNGTWQMNFCNRRG